MFNQWTQMSGERKRRTVLLAVQFIFLGSILWATRATLVPYIFGLVLAYLLSPVVSLFERGFLWLSRRRRMGFLKHPARILSIVVSYLLLIALIAGFIALVVPMAKDQAVSLWDAREGIWEALSRWGENLIAQYRLLPAQVQTQAEESLTNLSTWVTRTVQQALEGTVGAITYTASLILAILIIPFWTFFLLKDYDQLKRSALSLAPTAWHEDILAVLHLLDRSLSSYLRGQLLLGLIIGSVSAIALTIAGVRFSLLLGLIAGVCELIPNLGPVLGAIPALLVALAQDPGKALFVLIFAIVIQQIENLFLTPRILGGSVQLHPAVVMVVLVIGSELGGVIGLFLAPVVTALLRDLFKYIYYRLDDEPLPPEAAMNRVYRGEALELEV
ncbi:MAG: AI-2E family transporter [Anaerolineae bacterium]|nr:AI-2E family transporter [Anaerolineae bacterium]